MAFVPMPRALRDSRAMVPPLAQSRDRLPRLVATILGMPKGGLGGASMSKARAVHIDRLTRLLGPR